MEFNFTEEDLKKQSGFPSGSIKVTFEQNIAVVTLKCGEQNRINWTFLKTLGEALDEVERNESAQCAILTGDGKFFSNGIDLEWFSYMAQKYGIEDLGKFRNYMSMFWERMLTFPMPLIAAINGHVFAGGAVLALLCDYRIMRQDRGWFCLNEVHLGMQFSDGTVKLIRNRLPNGRVFSDVAVMGKRYTGPECLKDGIVNETCINGETLLPQAKEFARKLIKNGGYKRDNLKQMKTTVYKEIVEAFNKPEVGKGFMAKL